MLTVKRDDYLTFARALNAAFVSKALKMVIFIENKSEEDDFKRNYFSLHFGFV